MNEPILEIKNLGAGIEGKHILKGVNLTISSGEVHAIMGPNGSGKSTLAAVLAGRDGYDVTAGGVLYGGKNLLELKPEERAREGLFLAFQYPVEIPGVNSTYFLKAALNEIRKHNGQPELDAMEFLALVKDKMKLLELREELLKRSVNEGFSGGEKKRAEIFQMAVLEPKLAILDETDSGLDIDALKIVANGVNKLKRADNAQLVITHYQRLLNYIVPDFVHVLCDGRIVRTGDKQLALDLEEGLRLDCQGEARRRRESAGFCVAVCRGPTPVSAAPDAPAGSLPVTRVARSTGLLPRWLPDILDCVRPVLRIGPHAEPEAARRRHRRVLRVKTPEFLVVVLPIALLLALLYTLTNHARHHEITAIRAAGVSLWRLCLPYLAVGFAASLALFALNELCVPDSAEAGGATFCTGANIASQASRGGIAS